MKKKLAKLIDLKSIITLLLNVAMIVMLFWYKEIDREILMIFSTAYGSVMAYYFSRKEKE